MAVSRVSRGPRLSENGQLYDVLGASPSPRAASAPSFHSYCTAPAACAASSAHGGAHIAECDDGPRGTRSEDFTGFQNIKDLTVSGRQEAVKQTFPFQIPARVNRNPLKRRSLLRKHLLLTSHCSF